ncbi:Thiolase-like [Populus alba x Populus x berolinensis]|nr:Thiolase-like [Populus alba x Populus x berolinensis]
MDDAIFDTLDELLAKTGVSPSEIDIIVASVSLFSPAPSLTARVINRYKMRKCEASWQLLARRN